MAERPNYMQRLVDRAEETNRRHQLNPKASELYEAMRTKEIDAAVDAQWWANRLAAMDAALAEAWEQGYRTGVEHGVRDVPMAARSNPYAQA